jgi:hypothetical protein
MGEPLEEASVSRLIFRSFAAVVLALAIAVVIARLGKFASPETVVLDLALSGIIEFVRWVAEFIVDKGIELSDEVLAWLREQWERIVSESA